LTEVGTLEPVVVCQATLTRRRDGRVEPLTVVFEAGEDQLLNGASGTLTSAGPFWPADHPPIGW
jgi:hypothetical protein